MKTHFRMPWYHTAQCGSGSEHHSAKPADVTCKHCRRWNLNELSKRTGPPAPTYHDATKFPVAPFKRAGMRNEVIASVQIEQNTTKTE